MARMSGRAGITQALMGRYGGGGGGNVGASATGQGWNGYVAPVAPPPQIFDNGPGRFPAPTSSPPLGTPGLIPGTPPGGSPLLGPGREAGAGWNGYSVPPADFGGPALIPGTPPGGSPLLFGQAGAGGGGDFSGSGMPVTINSPLPGGGDFSGPGMPVTIDSPLPGGPYAPPPSALIPGTPPGGSPLLGPGREAGAGWNGYSVPPADFGGPALIPGTPPGGSPLLGSGQQAGAGWNGYSPI